MYDSLIKRQDAIDAFGLSEKTRKYGGDHSGYDTMMLYEIQDVLESLPSADEQDDNRLYIRIYANDEPSMKAEKLYQICGETESQEVAQWLKEYFPSADRPTKWIPVSEKPPETGDSVLVTYSDEEVGIVWSARPKVWGKYEKANNLIFPVAWMPLPEPYRKDGEA